MHTCDLIRHHQNLKKIHAFLVKTPLATLSTLDPAQTTPQSALVAFTQNEKLELYFMTFVDSRKYANLQQQHAVSFVIGFEYTTVQYEGVASELLGCQTKEALLAFALKDTPCSAEFLDNPRARFFKVVPTWVRYSDYTICPAEMFETRAISESNRLSSCYECCQ